VVSALDLPVAPPVPFEERHWIDPELVRKRLDAAEREVALAAVEPAGVRATASKHVGETFLSQSPGLPMGPHVASDDPLQLAFHAWKAHVSLLDSLHTHK